MILNCALIWRPYISIEMECRWPWHLIDPYAVVLVSYHLHLPLDVGWQTTWATSKPRDRSYSNHDRNYASSLCIITGANMTHWKIRSSLKEFSTPTNLLSSMMRSEKQQQLSTFHYKIAGNQNQRMGKYNEDAGLTALAFPPSLAITCANDRSIRRSRSN